MNSTRIFLYRLQGSNIKLFKDLAEELGLEGVTDSTLGMIGFFDGGSVSIRTSKAIIINFFDEECEIVDKTIEYLLKNINAEYIVVSRDGVDTSYEISQFKPRLYNKLKYKIKDKVSKW